MKFIFKFKNKQAREIFEWKSVTVPKPPIAETQWED